MQATFFCIGKNVVDNTAIMKRIQSAGHSIGNHTMNHSNAWKMDFTSYKEDVKKCEEIFVQQQIKLLVEGRLRLYVKFKRFCCFEKRFIRQFDDRKIQCFTQKFFLVYE